jgi:hypothetical protein
MTMTTPNKPDSNAQREAPAYIYEAPDDETVKLPRKRKNDFSREGGVLQNMNRPAAVGGVVLIVLGVTFLLVELGVISGFDNWWALFFFVPGLVMLYRVWATYLEQRRLPDEIKARLVGSLVLITLGTIFLFELSFSMLWPLLLIIIGAGLLLGWIGND